jgi:hypothetical protein
VSSRLEGPAKIVSRRFTWPRVSSAC